jgi:hypothetical protein
MRQVADAARQNAARQKKDAEAAWTAGEPARNAAAATAQEKAFQIILADLETRMEARAQVGKRSCSALVGVLDPTARPRKSWLNGTFDASVCERITKLLEVYQFYYGTDLREGIREHPILIPDLPYGCGGKVAIRVYDYCKEAGFRPVISCTKRSTRETWCSIELSW